MPLKFAANLSMLYTEVPFLERFRLAARAGFSVVEFLHPYKPGVQNVKRQLDENGLKVALFNLPAGESERGEWGLLSVPSRADLFRKGFEQALEAALIFDCHLVNTMFGNLEPGATLDQQMDCARTNLLWAAPIAREAGIDLLIEPLNTIDNPYYALTTTRQAVQFIRELGIQNVKLQYDIYQAQMTEGNLLGTIKTNLDMIAHIQFADVPGRHQPGAGEINFPFVFDALEKTGYAGYLGIEYRPLGSTDESLSWLPHEQRAC
jgi:hydroxypyruvate isomerase